MKRKLTIVFLSLILISCLFFIVFGNPIVTYHNYELKKAILSIKNEEIILNDIVPFKWDIVYTFEPYTSKTDIEKTIGFKSNSIHETISEGMVQLIFVHNNHIVSSICSYVDNLGYYIYFTGSIMYDERAVFSVEQKNSIVSLIKQ